jgi:hypothetical protein
MVAFLIYMLPSREFGSLEEMYFLYIESKKAKQHYLNKLVRNAHFDLSLEHVEVLQGILDFKISNFVKVFVLRNRSDIKDDAYKKLSFLFQEISELTFGENSAKQAENSRVLIYYVYSYILAEVLGASFSIYTYSLSLLALLLNQWFGLILFEMGQHFFTRIPPSIGLTFKNLNSGIGQFLLSLYL